jgi:hypothetical protein
VGRLARRLLELSLPHTAGSGARASSCPVHRTSVTFAPHHHKMARAPYHARLWLCHPVHAG